MQISPQMINDCGLYVVCIPNMVCYITVKARHQGYKPHHLLVYIAAVQPVTVIDQGRQNANLKNLSESLGEI